MIANQETGTRVHEGAEGRQRGSALVPEAARHKCCDQMGAAASYLS